MACANRRPLRWWPGCSGRYLLLLAALLFASPGLTGPLQEPRPASAPASLVIEAQALATVPIVIYLKGNSAKPDAATTGWIYNEGFQFKPFFQVLSLGGTVNVINKDPTLHNTHLAHAYTLFNVAVPLPGIRVQRTLSKAGVFSVRCDLHPNMRAWLFVTENPYYAVLETGGSFHIDGIPAGEHLVHIWDPETGERVRLLRFAPGETRRFSLSELRNAGTAPKAVMMTGDDTKTAYWLLGAVALSIALLLITTAIWWQRRRTPQRPSLYRIDWDRYR